ncbi:MAG: ABC transporter ATP-binding protein [Promethearchaeota archaeon]
MMQRSGGPMRGPGPPGSRFGVREKATDFRGTMGKLFRYMGRYKWLVLLAFIFAAASTTAMIVGPKILGTATTTLINGLIAKLSGTGDINFVRIGGIILEVLLIYIISAIFGLIQGWIMANVATNVAYRFRRDISEKINSLPLKYFDRTTHGEVLSRITNDVDTINQTLSLSLTQIITSLVSVVGILVMMFTISWIMTLVALAMLPLSMILMGVIIGRSQKYFKQQQDYLGHVNGHVEEMYGGHIVVKSFSGEAKSIEKFKGLNNRWYQGSWKANFFSGMMMPIMFFISNLGYVGVTILGAWLAIQNIITVGDIQAFIQYIRSFTQPLTQLANVTNVLQQTVAAAERVFKFLDEEEEIIEVSNPIDLKQVRGLVEFRNVNFGYSPDKIVIHNFSLIAQPGQKVAIVGPTGAGKTTLVKLLMRFYELNSGSILVDDHDIREMTREDLRQMFGMVLQETWLYNASILNNIRFSNQDVTDEEVYVAARIANVDHFVKTLPDGYNMTINEEIGNISQGQMQLLTIARAVLADPPILILDEATSSVDTHTEILIQNAMDALMQNRTSFVIAHRLSTIRNADLILAIRDGEVVEQGTHKELMDLNGYYAELYNSQFEVLDST